MREKMKKNLEQNEINMSKSIAIKHTSSEVERYIEETKLRAQRAREYLLKSN